MIFERTSEFLAPEKFPDASTILDNAISAAIILAVKNTSSEAKSILVLQHVLADMSDACRRSDMIIGQDAKNLLLQILGRESS